MRKSAIIGLITIALCVGFLVSLNADTNTYSTFSEAAKDPKEFHVMGYWEKTKGMHYDALKDANRFEFFMKDEKGKVNKVVYAGTKPQDFERSEKLVLIGKMDKDTFYASKILMKCPSKYNNDLVEVKQDGTVQKEDGTKMKQDGTVEKYN